jgi:hypothetical protein
LENQFTKLKHAAAHPVRVASEDVLDQGIAERRDLMPRTMRAGVHGV